MSYTAPSVSDFKSRFPAFASVADGVIETGLSEAGQLVDNTWNTQEDFTLGRLLYAAHVLTLDGHGISAEAEMAANGLLGFDSITSGKLSVKRASGDAGGSPLMQTQYGRRFNEVLLRNRSGPRIV